MSKWRPSEECLYVIPDVHGAYSMLEMILKRILPLRTTGGVQDKIVFLGDYIDRHIDSPKLLDRIISLKKEYPDNVICLCGNHERMMLEALGVVPSSMGPQQALQFWIYNGGFSTIVGYLERAGLEEQVTSLPPGRILDLVPKEHIDFMLQLSPYHKHGDFCFAHGGYDPAKGVQETPLQILIWDRSLLKLVQLCIQEGKELPWNEIIVVGHNSNGRGEPVIKDKFMMLDCGSPKRLLVVEVNSLRPLWLILTKKDWFNLNYEKQSRKRVSFDVSQND